MRVLLFLLLAFPVVATAQINKSANEHAREITREYIVNKIFKGKSYQPVWFSELKERKVKRSDIAWTLEHRFVIANSRNSGFDKNSDEPISYHFLFFLDSRMKVLRAESFAEAKN